jgi:hypothetical protein
MHEFGVGGREVLAAMVADVRGGKLALETVQRGGPGGDVGSAASDVGENGGERWPDRRQSSADSLLNAFPMAAIVFVRQRVSLNATRTDAHQDEAPESAWRLQGQAVLAKPGTKQPCCSCPYGYIEFTNGAYHIKLYAMPKASQALLTLPPPVADALRQLGQNIAVARVRRRESQRVWAQRLGVSVPTLVRLEQGDPGVGVGIVATALWLIGRVQALPQVADPQEDRGALEHDVRAALRRRASRRASP